MGHPLPLLVAQHISTEANITSEELHAATKLQLNHGRKIVRVSTAHIEVVQAITQIHHLRLGGKDYPTYTYVTSPDNSIKGVVLDTEPGSSPENLLHHLEAPGYRILHARLLGNTGTALVTFEGRKISPNSRRQQNQARSQSCPAFRPNSRPGQQPRAACPGPNRHQREHPPNRKTPVARLFNLTTPGRSPTPTHSRFYRKLKLKIATLTEEAFQYASKLAQSNWHQVCDRFQGTLSTARTWSFLRHLLDPTKGKRHSSQTLRKIIHDHPGTNADILRGLTERYIGPGINTDYPNYRGSANPDLDRPFTTTEITHAVVTLTRNTAPGKDGIQNRLLRDLNPDSLEDLTTYFNHI
ncbi:uncharacterized protein ISCGN_009878 [Ixodes scapularis]